jgi:hypothetical protein
VGAFEPIKRKSIEVVGRHAKPLLVLRRDFISPTANPNAGGAQRIEGSHIMAWFDQPIVFKRIGQQQH